MQVTTYQEKFDCVDLEFYCA